MTQPEPEATEASIAALWLAAITAWLALVLPAVMTAAGPVPAAMWAFEGFWRQQVDKIMPTLISLARRGWLRTADDLGERIPWDPNDPDLAELVEQTRNLLYQIPDRLYREILKTLEVGRDRGESPQALAARVDNILNVSGSVNWPERAKVIARTEINRFTEIGGLAAARRHQRDTGEVLLKQWEDRDDSRVRASHAEVDNELRRLGEPFHVGKSSLQHPEDPTGHPDDVVNCVPGSALVRATDVEAVFRFEFQGPILTLRGKSGLTSTVSVNHPVVTECGWLPASQVKEGMYLLRTLGVDGRLGIANPDPQGSYATIEQVYDALTLLSLTHRVISLPVNFYGDIPVGQVDVVFADRPLSINLDTEIAEEFSKFCLSCADLPNPPGSSGFQSGQRNLDALEGFVGGSNLIDPGFRSHEGPLHGLGLGLGAQDGTGLFEPPGESTPTDSQAVRDLLEGSPGHVFLDEIVDIVNVDFAGHLYTLQTGSGIYIADNTVSHNCRCRLKIRRSRRG